MLEAEFATLLYQVWSWATAAARLWDQSWLGWLEQQHGWQETGLLRKKTVLLANSHRRYEGCYLKLHCTSLPLAGFKYL